MLAVRAKNIRRCWWQRWLHSAIAQLGKPKVVKKRRQATTMLPRVHKAPTTAAPISSRENKTSENTAKAPIACVTSAGTFICDAPKYRCPRVVGTSGIGRRVLSGVAATWWMSSGPLNTDCSNAAGISKKLPSEIARPVSNRKIARYNV